MTMRARVEQPIKIILEVDEETAGEFLDLLGACGVIEGRLKSLIAETIAALQLANVRKRQFLMSDESPKKKKSKP